MTAGDFALDPFGEPVVIVRTDAHLALVRNARDGFGRDWWWFASALRPISPSPREQLRILGFDMEREVTR